MSVLVGGCPGRPAPARSLVLVPPFSGFSPQNVWVDGFTNAGVYVLLALGLNIVVGMSGLLLPRLRGVLRDRRLRVRLCRVAVLRQ